MAWTSSLRKAATTIGAAGFLLFCGNAAGQGITKTAPVPSHITLAGPQRTQEPRPQPRAAQGVIEGYVYWDDSTIKHVLPNSCSGLSVTVSSGGVPLATATGDLAYMGDFSNNVVCRYDVKGLPVGRSLQVQANVTAPSAFSPVTIAGGGSQTVMITAGSPGCLGGEPLYPTPSELASGWNSCADIAYNVNFVLLRTNEAGMPARSPVRLAPGVAVQNPANGPAGSGSTGNPAFRSLTPRSGSDGNTSTGSGNGTTTLRSLSPRGGSNSGSGNSGTVTLTPLVPHGSNPGSGGGITAGTKNADTLNPQPYPPKGNSSMSNSAGSSRSAVQSREAEEQLRAELAKAPVQGKVIKAMASRRTVPANAAILLALQKQRQAADVEASRVMKLGIQPQGQPGMLGQPSQLMSTSGGSATVSSVGAQAKPVVTNGTKSGSATQPLANHAMLAAPSNIQTAARPGSVGSVGPSQTLNASGNAAGAPTGPGQGANLTQPVVQNANSGSGNRISARMATLSPSASAALLCAADPSMRILNAADTFTPIDKYNLYVIRGCSFGNLGPNSQVYIYWTGAFRENFVIKFWSDNRIVVSLDPSISGVPDLNDVVLVVQRADSQEAEKSGFKFYAARETVLLQTIPQSWVILGTFPNTFYVQYFTPPPSTSFPQWGPGPGAGTTYVTRFADGAKFDPSGEFDYYSFFELAAGWTTENFEGDTYLPYCPSASATNTVTYQQDFGTWSGSWDGNNIRIGLADTSCSGFATLAPWINYQNHTGSSYSLKVWVIGPRGTDPLTGQPKQ